MGELATRLPAADARCSPMRLCCPCSGASWGPGERPLCQLRLCAASLPLVDTANQTFTLSAETASSNISFKRESLAFSLKLRQERKVH